MIIAIDGRSGAGKSTLARTLEEKLGVSVVHMDDFFLQLHQRTKERFDTPGGNIDSERFFEEIDSRRTRIVVDNYELLEYIKGLVITDVPMKKTTTAKIKRYEEERNRE
mgnify:CR=1 FL=1